MAMTREQAKAFYDKAVEAGYSDEEITAELKKRNAAPSPEQPQDDRGLLSKAVDYIPHAAAIRGAVSAATGGEADQSTFGRYGAGGMRGLADLAMQGRQVAAKYLGTEDLGELNKEEEERRKYWDPRTGGIAGSLGQVVGQAAPGVAATIATGGAAAPAVGGALSRGGQLALRSLAGGVGGGLGGLSQNLTAEEEESGKREYGGMVGAALGAALPGGEALIRGGANMLRKTGVDEAMEDYFKKAFNLERGTSDVLPSYENVGNKIEATKAGLKEQARTKYAAAETGAGLPSINMGTTYERASEVASKLPQDLVSSLNPRARKVIEGLRTGTSRDTGIVDVKGKAMTLPENATFEEVRETIRQLRKERRRGEVNPNSVASSNVGLLRDLEQSLQKDVEVAIAGDKTGKLAAKAKEAADVDQWYKTDVLPFYDKKTELGRYSLSPQAERNTRNLLLSENSGMTLKELKERVPGVEEDLRRIHAHDALSAATPATTIKKLEGGTTGEVLLTKEQRTYQAKLAKKLRERGESGEVTKTVKDILRAKVPLASPLINAIANATGGMEKYGAELLKNPGVKKSYIDMLRGMVAGQAAADTGE